MDPLSLTAGILSMSTTAAKILRVLSSPDRWKDEGESLAAVEETRVYSVILDEIGQIALSGTSALPESAKLGLQLCERNLRSLEHRLVQLDEKKKFDSVAIQKPLKDFRRSIKLLRDIVMDSLTHGLLQEQESAIKSAIIRERPGISTGRIHISNVIDITQSPELIQQQVDGILQQMSELFKDGTETGRIYIENIYVNRDLNGQLRDPTQDPVEQLRDILRNAEGPQNKSHTASDPFSFTAHVLNLREEISKSVFVYAKLDTGSRDNWISDDIITRAELQSSIVPWTEGDSIYLGFGGNQICPTGIIEVTWARTSTSKSWITTFLVISEAPFDMVLGRDFIVKEGLLAFGEPVLGNESISRLAPLSNEEYQQMERNIRERGAASEELAMTRDARDAAARRRRREEKAASRMSRATTPGFLTPAGYGTTSGSQTPSTQSFATSIPSQAPRPVLGVANNRPSSTPAEALTSKSVQSQPGHSSSAHFSPEESPAVGNNAEEDHQN